jgi:hypothetical protein
MGLRMHHASFSKMLVFRTRGGSPFWKSAGFAVPKLVSALWLRRWIQESARKAAAAGRARLA